MAKKPVNQFNWTDAAVETFARCVWPDIVAILRVERVSGALTNGSVSRPCRLNGTMARTTKRPEDRRRSTGPDAGSVPLFSFTWFFLACRAVFWASVQVRLVRDKEIIRTHRPQGTIGSDYIDEVEHRGFEPLASTMRMSRADEACLHTP